MAGKPIILTVSRRFDAPAETVFDAWLDPDFARKFWFKTPDGVMQTCEIDARVGGKFLIVEKRGDQRAEHFGRFDVLDRPNKLVFSFATDRDEPLTQVTIDIAKDGQGCMLTLSHELSPEGADFADRARHGWSTILESLAKALA